MALSLLVAVIYGCSDRATSPGQRKPMEIAVSLKEFGMSSNVTRITLKVTGAGFDSIMLDTGIVNGLARFDIEVPFGRARVFELSAFSEAQILLYHGVDTVDVSAGSITEVPIYMSPQVPMIKISPMYQNIGFAQPSSFFSIEVYNVDSLFGLSLRVEIDSTVIHLDSAFAGGYLGNAENVLFFSQLFSDYIPIGYTMRGNQQPQGVSGSGEIGRVYYTAKSSGTTALTINPGTLKLIDWQGNPLPRQRQLYIENGAVEVRSGS